MNPINDGIMMLLDEVTFKGDVLGLISADGIDWGGDDPTETDLNAAQRRDGPVKSLITAPGTDVLTFQMIQLIAEEIAKIAGLLLEELTKRCKEQLSIDVSFKDSVRKWLADTGYDAKYGARPLKRVIQNKLEDPMADEILAGKIKNGDHVDVKVVNGKVKISVREEG